MTVKICRKCGEERDAVADYYITRAGIAKNICKYCQRKQRNESYARTRKRPDRTYMGDDGRIYEKEGYSTRIHWSPAMLSILRRYYATTTNEDVAGMLRVSTRTMIRKARELGLRKDAEWMRNISRERLRLAHAKNKKDGYKNGFKKGNQSGLQFGHGRQLTAEQREKQRQSLHRHALLHPEKMHERSLRAWETRRANQNNKQ